MIGDVVGFVIIKVRLNNKLLDNNWNIIYLNINVGCSMNFVIVVSVVKINSFDKIGL